jgi:hypothetical protein
MHAAYNFVYPSIPFLARKKGRSTGEWDKDV